MAEVLSQSQIDALLNASKEPANDKPKAAATEEQKYRKYDFYSPRKFTKDRIKMLGGIFENYTRVINSRINGLLRTTCDIQVESIEEQRYYEFSNAISEGDVLTIVDMKIKNQQQYDEQPCLYHFSTSIMLSMIDRLMGGKGDLDESVEAGYIFTDVEIKLYENLVREMIELLYQSWENYIEMDFHYRRIETNPTLVQIMGLDETVIIVSIDLQFPNCTGRMNICLPGMSLTNVFNKIASSSSIGRSSGEDNSEEIMGILKDSELEIKAELAKTELKLQDIYSLAVGDVIDLSKPSDSAINLYVEDAPWFSGKLGLQNNNISVKILDTYYNQGRGEN